MNFVTIDWGLNYKHYAKDVGMIPYLLMKKYKFESTIVGTNNVEGYIKPYDDYCVKTEIVEKKYKSDFFNVLRYIRKNARNIDVLNLYHMNLKYNYIVSKVYRTFNPKGVIYLKLDMGYRGIEICQNENKIKRFLKKMMLNEIDLITDENTEVCRYLENLYQVKVKYVPNGWYGKNEKNYGFRDIDLLYVGRIGIREKSVDILLDAYAKTEIKKELYLVGRVEEEFQADLDKYFKNRPELKSKVHLLGEIRNAEELNAIYNRAKALVVPSRWESFGIVMVEAQAHGCYIIASDQVSSRHDIILNDRMGLIFKSEDTFDLADKIDAINNKNIDIDIIYNNAASFDWELIVGRLYTLLCKIIKEKQV